ncbi:MAG TPA: kelch repeat-containing protein [Puia sp.]|nr:kelch repeat-containing protein [Puia sp.]
MSSFGQAVSTFSSSTARAVPFGLGFYNNETVQDRRTSLDLTPERALAFPDNTELSFDFAFLPGHSNYFGYILRLVRNNTQNIDLLFDKVRLPQGYFRMVVGDKAPFGNFKLDSNSLFNSWNSVRLDFDYAHDRLVVHVNAAVFVQTGMHLSAADSFRISFGACPVQQFKTTDVPPVKIRDIRIAEGGKERYHWPLDAEKGTVAAETVRGDDATVMNPLWIRSTHYEWKPLDSLLIDGPASCAFDARNGILYLVGRDSLSAYTLSSGDRRSLPYNSGKQQLLAGNQSVYDPFDQRLYNLYPDQQLAAAFDFTSLRWDARYRPGDINYWHFNKFCSAVDSSIYFLNGYGHMLYKNSVFRYHIPTASWEKITPAGDTLVPRYLAAAGATERGDSVYIIGGYGSSSGQQILNPRNLYDMLRFDVRSRRVKKLFELSPGPAGEDFTFANSLVLDQRHGAWYGLIFNNEKYNSDLQLVKGSLSGPGYEAVGSKIPYPFHDIESFADLYYSPAAGKFVAVVFFTDSTASRPEHTWVHLYSLDGPPEPYVAEPPTPAPPTGHLGIYIGIALLTLITFIAAGAVFLHRRRSIAVSAPPTGSNGPAPPAIHGDPNIATTPAGYPSSTATPVAAADAFASPVAAAFPAPAAPDVHPRSSIYLFGDLQVFDTEGVDLTKQFSPLLKQLFLLIFLNSLKNKRGISSEKLNEILWFDKDEKSARNNRSVNIAKLKGLLDKTGGCNLGKETGYWKIDVDPSTVHIDYVDYLSITDNRERINKKAVEALAAITQRGSLLHDVEYPWLDPFKSDVSNHVIDTYLHFARQDASDPEFMIKLADYIFYFDSVNEDAMAIKCRALVQLGKHSLARNTYVTFVKDYKQIYGEDFQQDFQSVLQ